MKDKLERLFDLGQMCDQNKFQSSEYRLANSALAKEEGDKLISEILKEIEGVQQSPAVAVPVNAVAKVVKVTQSKPYHDVECYSWKYEIKVLDHCYRPCPVKEGDLLYLNQSPRITEQEKYPSASFLRDGEGEENQNSFYYPNYGDIKMGVYSFGQKIADLAVEQTHLIRYAVADIGFYKDRQWVKLIFSEKYIALYDSDNKRVAQYKLEQEK